MNSLWALMCSGERAWTGPPHGSARLRVACAAVTGRDLLRVLLTKNVSSRLQNVRLPPGDYSFPRFSPGLPNEAQGMMEIGGCQTERTGPKMSVNAPCRDRQARVF